jgi:hypothetical protein
MRRDRRRHRRSSRLARLVAASLIGAAAAAACAPDALAQNPNEPIVFGKRESRDVFALYNTRAETEVNYRLLHNEIKSSDGNGLNSSQTENRFEETFTLESEGAIVHPNLVELKMSGAFGLTQELLSTDGQDDSSFGTVLEYDLNATFLRKEDVVFTLYARRTQDTVDRQFGPTIDNTIQTEGAILDWRSNVLPTRLEVFHSDQTQSGIDDAGGEFTLSQNALIWHSEYRPTGNQAFIWDYTLNQVEESNTGQQDDSFVSHDASLSHTIDFGYKHRSNLTSSVNYFNQGGDFPLERFLWYERLRFVHNDTLETNYYYRFEDQRFAGLQQTTHRGQVGFVHRLFKSLVTSGWVGAEQVDRSDGSDSQTLYAHLDFDYHKKVPLGTFSAFLALNTAVTENSAQEQNVAVVDEQHTFGDPFPVILVAQNVDASTIRVTDASNLIVYTPGADYTVTDLRTRVEIARVLGGRLNNGDLVLVDYQILPQGKNTTTTNSYSIGGRYDIERGRLKGLSLYARFTDQRQSVDSDSALAFTPNSYTDTVIGTEYRFLRNKFTVGAEQEWYDSTLYPFDATRFFARYVDRFSQDTTGGVNLTYSIIQYPEEDNTLNLLMATGYATHHFSRSLYAYASMTLRHEMDDLRGTTVGLEEQVELNWHHRQTTVYFLVRNSNLSTDSQDSSFQVVRIGVRREF